MTIITLILLFLTDIIVPVIVVPLVYGLIDSDLTVAEAYRNVLGAICHLIRHGRLPDDVL